MIKLRRYRVIVWARTEIYVPTTGPTRKLAVEEALRNLEEYPDWAAWQITGFKITRLMRSESAAE